jgi:hypothetical protein
VPIKETMIPVGKIEHRIYLIRGCKVIVDADLAELYGVPTKRLNEQVKRNSERFPADFMFQLDVEEKAQLVANCDHLEKLKYSKSAPYAFTEHGAVMAASVLNTQQAIDTSLFIVRAFIKMRTMLDERKELQLKISRIESRLSKQDGDIIQLMNLVKKLIAPDPPPKKRRIGFY